MRAFVTGGSGFVGLHLLAHLKACGDDVHAPLADVTNLDALTQAISESAGGAPDVIYHLAGQADVGRSWNDVSLTWSVNTLGTVNLLEAARQVAPQARIIVISSAEVYGHVPPNELPITEERVLQPSSPYGASKIAAETAARFSQARQRVIIARPFNHLGPGQAPGFILPAVAKQIATAERDATSVIRLGNLEARRDMTSVGDVVRAYRLMAEHGHDGATYNVCSDVAVSMRELVDRMLALSTVSLTVELDETRLRPSDIAIQLGSSARLRADTGWAPTADLDEVLRSVLDEWREKVTGQ